MLSQPPSGGPVRGTEQLEAINIAELAGMSARAIAAALNERKVPTPAGGEWHSVTVIRVQNR